MTNCVCCWPISVGAMSILRLIPDPGALPGWLGGGKFADLFRVAGDGLLAADLAHALAEELELSWVDLARKHSEIFRECCRGFGFALPLIACLGAWTLNLPWLYSIAAISGMLGVFLGRWLFFAEAKHVVSLYY